MNKRTNWFLLNWEYREVDGRRRLVYVGDYYGFPLSPRGLRQLKLAFGLLTAALLAVYYAFAASGAAGGEVVYVGMPVLLSQIPLLFLLLGVGWLLTVKPRLTYRDVRGSVARIRWAGWSAAALLAAGTAGQLVRLLAARPAALDASEWRYLAGAVFCVADLIAMELLLRRYSAEPLPSGPAPLTKTEHTKRGA